MKLFEYSVAWKYSSENWEVGIVKASSREEAEELLRKEYPNAISISVYDTIDNLSDNEIYCIYSK